MQNRSFVELGSRSVHGGVRNLRPQLLLFITSPVDYPRSTIQSLKIVTHEMTQPLISSLMCRFTDRHAAVIAPIRNLSFSPLHTPRCALRRKGDRQSLSSHPYPTTHWGIKEPSPPLRTLCLKRRLQRCIPWVVGREGKKRDIYLQSRSGQLMSPPGPGTGLTSINERAKSTPACLQRRADRLTGAFYCLRRAALPIPALQSALCGKRLLPSPA